MAFDPSTAKPAPAGFDPSSAQLVADSTPLAPRAQANAALIARSAAAKAAPKANGIDTTSPSYQAALADARADQKRMGAGTFWQPLYQSAMLGFGDELSGMGAANKARLQGLLAHVGGPQPKYSPAEAEAADKQAYNEGLTAFAKAHPAATTPVQIAGGFLTPGLGALGEWAGAGKGLLGQMVRGAMVGTGVGAASGAGSAQDGQRMAGAAHGAMVGAALGGAAPAAVRAAAAPVKAALGAAKTVARAVNSSVGDGLTGQPLLDPTRVGAQRLAEAMQQDGITLDKAKAIMNGYLGKGLTPSLIDLAGPNGKTAALIRGSALKSTDARQVVADYADAVRGGAQTKATDMSYALTPNEQRPSNVVQAALKSDRNQQAAIEYPRSYSQPVNTDPIITAMGGATGGKAIGRAYSIADSRRLEPEMQELLAIKTAASNPSLPPPLPKELEGLSPAAQAQALAQLPDLARIHAQPIPPVTRLGSVDQVAQALGDMIEHAKAHDPAMAPGLIQRQNEIQAYLANVSKDYQEALNNYAQRSRNMDAIDVGASGLTSPANEYQQALQGLAGPSDHTRITTPDLTQDMAGVGLRQALVNHLQGAKEGTVGALNKVATTPAVADNLNATFGPDISADYIGKLRGLRDQIMTADMIDPNRGPRTAMNLQDMSGAEPIELPPVSAHGFLKAAIDKINIGAKLTDDEMKAMASIGVAPADDALKMLRMYQSSGSRFGDWLRGPGGTALTPAAAASATTINQTPQ